MLASTWGGAIPTNVVTIPTSWTAAGGTFPPGLASRPVRGVAAGVHPKGFNERHVDRVLSVHELIFVQAGVLPIAEESEHHHVARGEWIILRAGRRHYGCGPIDGSSWFYWVCFAVGSDVLGEGPTLVGRTRDPARVHHAFDAFLDDQRRGGITQQAADAYTSLLVHQLLPNSDAENPRRPRRIHDLVVAHVQANLGDPAMTTHTIAADLGYNPDYLGRAFRAAARRSIVSHIHDRRLAQARSLLENTQVSVTGIAAEVGFDDPRYFRRIFLRQTGVPPSEYRKLFA